jgi:hydroxymethylglutaryl-CoA lyase
MSKVHLFEMGLRDGLQNESRSVRLEDKVFLAKGLAEAGVREIELGAFVRKDVVPQMADTDALFKEHAPEFSPARLWALVPNPKGLERAIEAKVKGIAVFTGATESFTQRNIGMSIGESLATFREVIQKAKAQRMIVRGYLSTAFGCPYEGKVSAKRALKGIEQLIELGVFQVSIGDTIGVATPKDVEEVIRPALQQFGDKKIAVHFHDTRGTALANTLRALQLGVKNVDASVGGLGGCPFAPGATGNLATEDLVYMLDGLGASTGIKLEELRKFSLAFHKRIQRPVTSRYLSAYASQLGKNDDGANH